MEDSNPILARIRKLFALAGSSNEQEAKVAMEKANELMVKHNLDSQQVKMSSSDYDFQKVTEGRRASVHHRHILDLLNCFFFVNVIYKRTFDPESLRYIHTVNLVGRPINTQIATHVFEYLNRVYPELWRSFKGSRKVSSDYRYSYYHGLTIGIAHILRESRLRVEEERGLQLVKDQDLEDFTKDFCNGKIKKQDKGKIIAAARDQGIRDGLKVQIAPPIESKSTAQVALLTGAP